MGLDGFTKYFDRGVYYKEQANYRQALEEFRKAFSSLYLMFIAFEEAFNKGLLSNEDKIQINILLGTLIAKIGSCYVSLESEAETVTCLQFLIKVIESLDTRKDSFNVEQLQSDEGLREQKIFLKAVKAAKRYNDSSEIISAYSCKDPVFKEIFESFDKITKSNCCFIKSQGFSSSSSYSSDSSSDSCFIATAAYSTSTHPDLDTFRNFRDKKLLNNFIGKVIVSFYYRVSPSLAQYVSKQPLIKSWLKQQLEYLAQWMRNKGVTGR